MFVNSAVWKCVAAGLLLAAASAASPDNGETSTGLKEQSRATQGHQATAPQAQTVPKPLSPLEQRLVGTWVGCRSERARVWRGSEMVKLTFRPDRTVVWELPYAGIRQWSGDAWYTGGPDGWSRSTRKRYACEGTWDQQQVVFPGEYGALASLTRGPRGTFVFSFQGGDELVLESQPKFPSETRTFTFRALPTPVKPEHLPAFVSAVKSSKIHERKWGLYGIGELGPEAASAVPALIGLLSQKHEREIRGVLGQIGEPAAPALVQALGDEPIWERVSSILRDDVGPHATAALLGEYRNPKSGVRLLALIDLVYVDVDTADEAIAPDLDGAVSLLAEGLKHKNPRVRERTLRTILRLKLDAEEVRALVIDLLRNDQERSVRSSALLALRTVYLNESAIPLLLGSLKDDDPTIRRIAASALGSLGPAAKPAVPALAEALNDEDSYVRVAAAYALADIGPEAKLARNRLWAALRRESRRLPSASRQGVQVAIRYALARIGSDASEATRVLVEAMEDEPSMSSGRLQGLLNAMAKIGPEAKEAVSVLIRKLGSRDSLYAAKALASIGPAAKAAEPALIDALDDPNPHARVFAAEALGKISTDPNPAVAALVALLAHENRAVRRQAAEALGRLGPVAEAALPALREATNDRSKQVRAVAKEAIEKITSGA